MKIILNNIEDKYQAAEAFTVAKTAIDCGIKLGRNNYQSYEMSGNNYSVCKNKNSVTVYRWKHGC